MYTKESGMRKNIDESSDKELVEQIAILLNEGIRTYNIMEYKRASNKIRILHERHSSDEKEEEILSQCLNCVLKLKTSDEIIDRVNNYQLVHYVNITLSENFKQN